MAQGDITVFSKAKERMGDGELALSTGPWYVSLSLDSATDPTENDSDPGYNAGRSQDWSATTFEPQFFGGQYSAGGSQVDVTITDNWSLSGNVCTFDVDDVTWTQDASNPTSARWAVMYQNDANDYGLLFCDLGSDFNMTTGDLSITWNASGLFTLT
jgi:hypothetical protein